MLCYDLSIGSVDQNHPLYSWLLSNGASIAELAELTEGIKYDVFGVNFYPWSSHAIEVSADGKIATKQIAEDGHSLLYVLHAVHNRTSLPLFITETSAAGGKASRWLSNTIRAVRLARLDDLPVIGYTWFPLVTMIEWGYRVSDRPIEQHLLHLGLVKGKFSDGILVRRKLPVFNKFKKFTKSKLPSLSG